MMSLRTNNNRTPINERMFCCLIIHILHVYSARTFEIRILVKNKNKIQKYVVVNGRLRESPESTGQR